MLNRWIRNMEVTIAYLDTWDDIALGKEAALRPDQRRCGLYLPCG